MFILVFTSRTSLPFIVHKQQNTNQIRKFTLYVYNIIIYMVFDCIFELYPPTIHCRSDRSHAAIYKVTFC